MLKPPILPFDILLPPRDCANSHEFEGMLMVPLTENTARRVFSDPCYVMLIDVISIIIYIKIILYNIYIHIYIWVCRKIRSPPIQWFIILMGNLLYMGVYSICKHTHRYDVYSNPRKKIETRNPTEMVTFYLFDLDGGCYIHTYLYR